MFDGTNWSYPGNRNGNLTQDSEGTIWLIEYKYEESDLLKSFVSYYRNNEWNSFDISDINAHVYCLDTDDENIYFGTNKGLIEKSKS